MNKQGRRTVTSCFRIKNRFHFSVSGYWNKGKPCMLFGNLPFCSGCHIDMIEDIHKNNQNKQGNKKEGITI